MRPFWGVLSSLVLVVLVALGCAAGPAVEDPGAAAGEIAPTPSAATCRPVAGRLRTAVVLVTAGTAQPSCAPAAVRERFFDGERSVRAFYRDTSRGLLDVEGEVLGPVVIPPQTACAAVRPEDPAANGEAMRAWHVAADAAAMAAGIDLSGYDKRVYVLPRELLCDGATGWAASRSTWGRAFVWGDWCERPNMQAHELGHLLSLNHASTVGAGFAAAYGDASDVMGRGYARLNAPHMAELGWLPREAVVDVTRSGRYRIAPLDAASGGPQALVVRHPRDPAQALYLSYRTSTGFDALLPPELVGRTSVHRHRAKCEDVGQSLRAPTTLLATLEDHRPFADRGSGIRVTQLLHDAGGVVVEVELAPARDPATASLRAEIDAIVGPSIGVPDGRTTVGLAVGVLGPGVRDVLGWGRTRLGGSRVPDGGTIFEIGSSTKVFTGLLLAHAVTSGAVRLDDPVVAHLAPGARVPDWSGAPITLAHLATHTSGLPSFPDNALGAAPNPMAGYTVGALDEFLGRHRLTRAPGEAYAYSNLGFGLLGVALSLALRSTYEPLIAELVGPSLGMWSTRVHDDGIAPTRLAGGHAFGRPAPSFESGLAGGGALSSTAEDMLAFIAASVGESPSALDPALALMQEPRAASAEVDGAFGGPAAVGLGIEMRGEGARRVHVKYGATPGFTSFLCFDRSRRAGVILLANTGGFAAAPALARRILDVVSRGAR